ncbi:redox-sensing transcriptional repressor Rex [Chitinivibrio alkaliphilus]|uniref:Redox-sensing transcriptional repressor Rex n=1 Tax=Chitinivibrio alkaliphilus ACht1 TaxID=1313304 RepID=U7DA48_9BACT|nr:redox-sensing transcriptional repressor Rex [Chitinivibrio alkaliphilus]ERP38887.1 Redox-sensing transcriptional repressor rex [Chitinivibrio alkaliphilus ACht1]
MQLSDPTLKRLTAIYRVLSRLICFEPDIVSLSSTKLGEYIGYPAHTVRKDISYLGEVGNSGKGYGVRELHDFIAQKLGLDTARRAAVVGLGRIGSAILDYGRFSQAGFDVVAGFDSDINLVDSMVSSVPVYPSYDIPEIVQRHAIELAFLAVPAGAAEKSVARLVAGGIKGVVNFSPLIMKHDTIIIRNMDITGELTLLSALITVKHL